MTIEPAVEDEVVFTCDPVVGLDPRDPMKSARKLVAHKFTDARGRRTLHRHRGSFWQHSGSHYAAIDDEQIETSIWFFLETAVKVDRRATPTAFKAKRSHVSDIRSALQAVTALDSSTTHPAWLCDASHLPPATEFFAMANGLLHLPTGDLFPATPEYFGLNASDVVFDQEAPEPKRWLSFLGQQFDGDPEAIDLLQEWAGYTLTADTAQQKILLIVGPTRSGKGTTARVLTGLVGRNSVAAPTLASMSANFGLEPLIGKPLAIISDARLSGRSDQAAIAERLLSMSGEDSLTIDRKFKPAWTGALPTRFIILTNELPRLADASGALTKRFLVLVLENSFYGREDPGLTGRLLGELPGILNWARVGYARLRERGYFQQPESAREIIHDLEALSSPVTAFVRDRCKLGAERTVLVADLFEAWKRWCADNGRREPGTVQVFSRDLRAAFPGIVTRQYREDGDRTRRFEGISL